MKRDGATISLWKDTTNDHRFSGRFLNDSYDVLIAGGGITGVTTGLLLQKAGLRCAIAEAHTLCFGTTAGTTSHINTFLDTGYDKIQNDFGTEAAQLVARATNEGISLFRQHVSEYNIDCGFKEKDGYLYAENEVQAWELEQIELEETLKS